MAKRYSSDPKTRAAELVAEGKIGGKRKGAGRPRKLTSERQRKRASQVIAERARDVAPQMAAVLADVLLDDEATRSEKLRAVKAMVNIEGVESDRERDELADPASTRSQEIAATADEARERLAEMLNHPVSGPRLRAAMSGLLAEAGNPSQTG